MRLPLRPHSGLRARFFTLIPLWVSALLLCILAACSSARHVPQGQFLLNKVTVDVENDSTGLLKSDELINYVRQLPNHKLLWSIKFQLGIYNMSGHDTTKWYNRWVRKLGEAPVVYDRALTQASAQQLNKAMINKGFPHARVITDTVANPKSRKMDVTYRLQPGEPGIIGSVNYEFANDTLREMVMQDSAHFVIRAGDILDRNALETQRGIMTQWLRNNGYWAFTKDFITFTADTTAGSQLADLTVTLHERYPQKEGETPRPDTHIPYTIRSIKVLTDYDAMRPAEETQAMLQDSIRYRDLEIFYGKKRYLRPSVIYDNVYFRAGQPYRERDVDRTYEAFSRLGILKFINVRFAAVSDSPGELDAYILLTPGRSQSISFEVEGTNSEGDLGVAVGATYTHRNIGHGSETFTTKLRGAYESISGDLDGLLHNRYMEYSVETDLSFPKFKFPFLRESFKRKIKASTAFNLSFNYQERPEYTRIISTAGWSYRWTERFGRMRHIFTPLDINYVYLPESTNGFLDEIAPDNPLLRYSYENHFIMRLGYTFYYTTKRQDAPWTRQRQSNISTVRASVETAGNVLFAFSSIFNHRSNFHENPYKIFGINYSQYIKMEGDYSFLHIFDSRNSLAFHAGFGIGIPYGNSQILPFEKRFYGGGANGVRGWDVRTLGPGSFPGTNSVQDFIRQCGDIRFDTSVEYRAKLFWVLELGLFVDAGNIWTIRNYPSQPGGVFRFDKFYKQIAAAYGIGLRMDFNYFLIRFDLGMKAHNPARGAEPWPLLHPRWGRDRSFHFSIGYPF